MIYHTYSKLHKITLKCLTKLGLLGMVLSYSNSIIQSKPHPFCKNNLLMLRHDKKFLMFPFDSMYVSENSFPFLMSSSITQKLLSSNFLNKTVCYSQKLLYFGVRLEIITEDSLSQESWQERRKYSKARKILHTKLSSHPLMALAKILPLLLSMPKCGGHRDNIDHHHCNDFFSRFDN